MIPDFFSELTGWRRFSVRDHGRLLVSVNHPIPWTAVDPGPAACVAPTPNHPKDQPCPDPSCSCGYYAYKAREHAEQHSQGTLLARVLLWGRIVEHSRGYRAERIKLADIFVPPDYPEIAGLSSRYQIPVTVDEGARAWTSESLSVSSQLNQLQNQFHNQWNTLQTLNTQNYNLPYNPPAAPSAPQVFDPLTNQYIPLPNTPVIGNTIHVRLPQRDMPKFDIIYGSAQIAPKILKDTTPKAQPKTLREYLKILGRKNDASIMRGEE